MRIIGSLDTEQDASLFSGFLTREGIKNSFEPFFDADTQKTKYRIWVTDEDQIPAALEAFEQFKQFPHDPKYLPENQPFIPHPDRISKIKVEKPIETPLTYWLTYFILFICVGIFFWNGLEEASLAKDRGPAAIEVLLTPVQKELLFDYPKAFEQFEDSLSNYSFQTEKNPRELSPALQAEVQQLDTLPMWKGVFSMISLWHSQGWAAVKKVPMFEKIREGEVWRIFTPALLHRDFLHILFNMAWLWILGKQIEKRLSRAKMLLMIVIIAIVSNVAQYFMTGPFFLGFSGVVVGMVGFIWMRQRKAPWEGYPLHPSIVFFIIAFVAAMFLLELGAATMKFFSISEMSPHIANTAHIVGGITGLLLGRMRFFSRGHAE